MNYMIIEYTAGAFTIKLDDKTLTDLWTMYCGHHTKKLSAKAIRAFMSLSYDHAVSNTFGSDIANELSDPYELGNIAAIIHPEDYQCWECEDLRLAEWDNGTLLLTWAGEVMLSKMKAACEQERLRIIKLESIKNLQISLEF